ncbi:hypothetical protein AVEN_29250-1, partial [Araneus ventricosus]
QPDSDPWIRVRKRNESDPSLVCGYCPTVLHTPEVVYGFCVTLTFITSNDQIGECAPGLRHFQRPQPLLLRGVTLPSCQG